MIKLIFFFRLTLFIASSSIIIMTLITIIVLVSCFILCNEGKDMTFAQRSLINSMSSSSALNLIASHGYCSCLYPKILKGIFVKGELQRCVGAGTCEKYGPTCACACEIHSEKCVQCAWTFRNKTARTILERLILFQNILSCFRMSSSCFRISYSVLKHPFLL